MKIAFFGTGLMGSGFVRRLRATGHDVNVWNRTAEKARALEADGARAFTDPAAGLAGAEGVHHSLADDDLLALPVVDDQGALLGNETVDDAIDVILPTAWKKRIPRLLH
jgi:3-hydroxyisobutyrate dehydrogenase-like beta-hydroxyacid dehydrogenase